MTDEQLKDRRQLGLVGKISIATLLAVGLQCFGVIWWAADLTRRVEQLEITLERQQNFVERFARVETNVEWIRAELERSRAK